MQEGRPRIDTSVVALDASQIKSLGLLDHDAIDWGRVQRSVYLVHQNFHYEYPGPIADLDHHLIVLPPARHGDQKRLRHQLDVSVSPVEIATRDDAFGNVVLDLHIPFVETAIDFEAWIDGPSPAGSLAADPTRRRPARGRDQPAHGRRRTVAARPPHQPVGLRNHGVPVGRDHGGDHGSASPCLR
jgi:hypothetical protein